MTPFPLRPTTAYHEAGHATLADAYGVLMNVRLLPDPITYHYEVEPFRAGVIAYGGVLAQARYEDVPYLKLLYAGGIDDRQKIWQKSACVAFYLKETAKETRKRWRKIARKILDARWAVVKAVAETLLQRKRLTRQEVGEIVKQVSGSVK